MYSQEVYKLASEKGWRPDEAYGYLEFGIQPTNLSFVPKKSKETLPDGSESISSLRGRISVCKSTIVDRIEGMLNADPDMHVSELATITGILITVEKSLVDEAPISLKQQLLEKYVGVNGYIDHENAPSQLLATRLIEEKPPKTIEGTIIDDC